MFACMNDNINSQVAYWLSLNNIKINYNLSIKIKVNSFGFIL